MKTICPHCGDTDINFEEDVLIHGFYTDLFACRGCGAHGEAEELLEAPHTFKPTMIGTEPTYVCRTCGGWYSNEVHGGDES